MAITKASTQDCRQYYHLGLDLGEDYEEDFELEEGKLELTDQHQKDDENHPNLAEELNQAESENEKKVHKEVIINRLCDDNKTRQEDEDESQEICDVVIRSEPVNPPQMQSGQNGWGNGARARKMLLHKVAGAEFDQVTCGRQACCVIS